MEWSLWLTDTEEYIVPTWQARHLIPNALFGARIEWNWTSIHVLDDESLFTPEAETQKTHSPQHLSFVNAGPPEFRMRHWKSSLFRSIKTVVFTTKLNLLMPFGPLAILVHKFTGHNALEDSKTVFRQKDCFPEFIEDYCVSEFLLVSDLSVGNQSSNQTYRSKSRNVVDGDLQRRNCGWYGDTSLRIVENHISNVCKGLCTIQSREHEISFNHRPSLGDSGNTKGRVLLKNINVRWRMFAGSDWQETQKLGQQSKHGRDTAVCLELALSGVDFKCDVFGDCEVLVSKLSLSVQDLNFYDNSRDAPWKMVLGYYHSKDHPRESSSKALKFDLEAVKPDPLTPLEEYRAGYFF